MKHVLKAALVASLLGASTAFAQVPLFDLERLSLDPAAVSSMVIGTGEVRAKGDTRLSLAAHYENRPLVLNDDDTIRGGGTSTPGTRLQNVVGNRVTAHLGASVSLTNKLEVSLRIPVVAWQEGASIPGLAPVTSAGLGTPAFGLRYALMAQGSASPFNIAVASEALLPFGATEALAGSDRWAFTPRLEVGRHFEGFVVGGQAGMLLRRQLAAFPDGAVLGSEFQVGAVAATTGAPLRGELSIRGNLGYDVQRTMEVLAGARYTFATDWEGFALGGPGFFEAPGTPRFRGLIGLAYVPVAKKAPPPPPADPCAAGLAHTPAQCPALDDDKDGILNKDDVCPLVAGIAEEKGCPAKDSDADGIFDHKDKCPTVAGIAELEGCPAKDGDADGIPDHKDRCPDVAGVADNAGCPPAKAVLNVATGKIDILEKVYFDTGKATIQDRSFPLLDEVAQVLARNPQLTKVVVEGHTDSTGSARLNTKLSADRAKAVAAYLVGKGTDAARLDSKGFGSSRPVGDNKTAAGRDSNRRVEFTIP